MTGPRLAASAAVIRWRQRPAAELARDAGLAAEWDRLSAARGDLAFLAADCINCALDTLGSGNEQLLLGSDGDSLVAAFVLVPQGRLHWRSFQPSQLPLGAWVADARFAVEDVVDSLARQSPLRPLLLSITRIDPLTAARAADRGHSRNDDYIDTAWIDVEGTLEDYWAARGKNLRQNMRKQRSKLSAEGVALQMLTLTDAADMAGAVERYGQLESAGWKGGEGSAVHPDNPQGRFYRRLLEDAARRGEAVVYEYRFDDRTVAVNLCLLRRGTLVILKTTYDEAIKLYSPAFLLHQEMVEQWFTTGKVRRVEYFGKLMEWHTKWTLNRRVLYHLTVYRFEFLKRLAATMRARRQRGAAELPV